MRLKHIFLTYGLAFVAVICIPCLMSENTVMADEVAKEMVMENPQYNNEYLSTEIFDKVASTLEKQTLEIREQAYNDYERIITISWNEDDIEIAGYKWDKGKQIKVELVDDEAPGVLYINNQDNEKVATVYLQDNEINELAFKKVDYSQENFLDFYKDVYEIESFNAILENTHVYYGYVQNIDGESFYAEKGELISNTIKQEQTYHETAMLNVVEILNNIDDNIQELKLDEVYDYLLNNEDVRVIDYKNDSILYSVANIIACEYRISE